MKKRFFYLLLIVIFTFSVFSITGCNNNNTYQSPTYGVKYIASSCINTYKLIQENPDYLTEVTQGEHDASDSNTTSITYKYFLLNKDGTGEFYCFYYYHNTKFNTLDIEHFTKHFTYEIVEDTLITFQSGLTLHEGDNQNSDEPPYDDYSCLLISKNYIIPTYATSLVVYTNENQISKMPNFNNPS